MASENIHELITTYSAQFDYKKNHTAIILAAGHGKRIKSQTSKMLHKIWEIPTVERVYNACKNALGSANIIIVVGIKAEEVIKTIGKRENVIFVYQEEQLGTGHAVQVALNIIDPLKYNGLVYVFPGDMGLINGETIEDFQEYFHKSDADMTVLTGLYEGRTEDNYYGRVIRVPNRKTAEEQDHFVGNVIEILEYKDIANLDDSKPYIVKYKGKEYNFSKKELLENREFNSGVYAFKYPHLDRLIKKIQTNNVQKEMYLTDLIYLFNEDGLKVSAVSPKEQYVLMGFNNKSVLKEMDGIARKLVYDKLKDIIEIDDPDDFFIHEDLLSEIIELDKKGLPLDIKIGKGAYVGKDVIINYNLTLMRNVYLNGKIKFGKNIVIKENSHLSCFYGQCIEIGDNVEIFSGDIIKGNVKIGNNTVIESGVRITGSDEYPTVIGDNVTIKGISYIFGSQVCNNIHIEHSVLVRKKICKPDSIKNDVYKVRYFLPEPEGIDAIEDLKK